MKPLRMVWNFLKPCLILPVFIGVGLVGLTSMAAVYLVVHCSSHFF